MLRDGGDKVKWEINRRADVYRQTTRERERDGYPNGGAAVVMFVVEKFPFHRLINQYDV